MRIGDTEVSIDPDLQSGDLACEVCNAPLIYAGRGRKPRYCDDHKPTIGRTASPTGRSSGTVNAALASMNGLYNMVAMLLYPASPAASEMFTAGIPQAQAQNKAVFELDPKLAQSIARGGAKGGKATFIATNAMLIVPPIRVAMADLQARAKTRPPKNGGAQQGPPASRPQAASTSSAPAPSETPGTTTDLIDPVDRTFQEAQARRRAAGASV